MKRRKIQRNNTKSSPFLKTKKKTKNTRKR